MKEKTNMTKIEERLSLLEQENKVLQTQLNIQTTRISRVVQVLLKNLTMEQLDIPVSFNGLDCHNIPRMWFSWGAYPRTLRDFLVEIVDP